jgi:hypothetical protein
LLGWKSITSDDFLPFVESVGWYQAASLFKSLPDREIQGFKTKAPRLERNSSAGRDTVSKDYPEQPIAS